MKESKILESRMMKRPAIGDIVEIPTKRGLVYAQYTHQHKDYGEFLRIFQGFHEARVAEVSSLSNQRSNFQTFYPLTAAVNQSLVRIAGTASIPDQDKQFPVFRSGVANQETMIVKNWWLWDGEKEWMVGDLTAEQWKYPLRGVWNHAMLVERIEQDWSQEGKSW